MQTRVYDLCSDLVLYAHWTEAEDPAQELVVNIMEDQQDWVTGDWAVSLREAIEYAAEHPDVVDATGQRRITFDPRVFAPGSSNVVWVTSQIALAGDYFPSDKPLVIEGPTSSQVVLHGSDTHNRFLKLTSGTNRVEVMNLAFYGFRTPNSSQSAEQDGGVFYLKGVNAVVAENCRFEANWADDEGSVAHLDSKGTRFEAERCSFIENRSLYGVVSSSGPDKVIVVRGCTFYANSVYSGIRDLVWASGSCQLLQNTFVCDPDHLLPRVCPEGGTCQGNLCVRTTPAAGEPEYEADQVLVDGFTPKTAVVDGVLQTFFPIKKGSPADGTGVRIEGRTHDIVGKPIPAADAKVNGISLGSWNQDWEKASTVVTITEDIVDDTDGETSFREAIATSASDACWTNAAGERAVTFASALWDQAGDALVIPCRDRAFPVANPTNAPLVVTGPDTGTKGLVFEGVGSDHVLFEGGEGTGLVLRNLTARGGHGGRGGALDFSADGCHFLVSNGLFTANSATNGIVCGRGDVLNCSFLGNSGCGDVHICGLLIESTLLGTRPSELYEENGTATFALGCTAPGGLQVPGNRIYGCITRAEELGGVQLQSYKVGTVTQYAYPIAWGSRFAGKGYFLWHNDDGTALAYSKLIDGRDKTYVCRASGTEANRLYDIDVTGRRISPESGDNRNSAGSYAVPCEPASLVVDSVSVYDDDGEPNFNDGVVTLRDAIFYAHERPELAGSNGPGYRITFDPQLYKDATNGLSLLAPRPYTVDGTNFSSKTPLTIAGDPDTRPWPGIDQFQAERLFVVSNSAELVLANLALRGNGLGQAPSFDAQALSPLDVGRRLAPRTIYAVWTDTTIEATAPGQSGLVVEGTDAEPSVIYLYDGAKLTVKGAPAQGTVGGGAGIELTGGHHLLVCGNGSVVATGGDAAPGSAGEAGLPGSTEGSAEPEPSSGVLPSFKILLSWNAHGGNGGTGGTGGGGAGAGIGTSGAAGGAGGTGGSGASSAKSDVKIVIPDDLTPVSVPSNPASLGDLGGEPVTSIGTLSIVGTDTNCVVSAASGHAVGGDTPASSGADSSIQKTVVHFPKSDKTVFSVVVRGGQGGAGGIGGAAGQAFGSGGKGGMGGMGGCGGGCCVAASPWDPAIILRYDPARWPEGDPAWGKVQSYRSQAEDLIGGSNNVWTRFTSADAMAEWPFVKPIFVRIPIVGGAGTSGACVSLTRGRLAMDNCRVSDFRRDFGGMLVLDTNSGATFNRTVFSKNSAVREGGVIYGQGGSLSFTNCVFDANTATLGGVLSGSNTTVLVEGSTISSNTATSAGGAIYLKGRSDLNPTRLTLANCSVFDNAATSLGGAVWGEHVDTVLVGTTFRGNTVATADGNGAGLFLQGKGSTAALANVLLVGNGVKGTTAELNFAVSDLVTNATPIRVYSSKIGAGFPSQLTAGKDDATRAYVGSTYADVPRTYLDSNYMRRGDVVDVDGVLQRFERTQPTAESIGNPWTGWWVRHSADWSSVTVASNATAETRWTLRGRSDDAKTDVTTDISRRGFENPEPQMGSFWMVQDRPSLVVDTLDDVIDAWDAKHSLHEILNQIMDAESPWATNLVKNGRFDITFKDGLEGTILQTIDPVKITGLAGCVFTVTGPTNRTIAIDGQDRWRAFAVGVSNTLHVSNLTLTNCLGRTYGSYPADGGGILNQGDLVVSNCAFYACAAGRNRTDPMGDGGAIHTTRNAKTLVKNATFGDNVAAHGGALAVADGGQLTVLHSTFDGNVAQGGGSVYDANGGALYVKGTTADALVANCTFTANEVVQGSSAAPGHAVAVDGSGAKAPTAKLVNCVLCANGTNDLQATRGSQVRLVHTLFGARTPGADAGVWDDVSVTSNLVAGTTFAHLDDRGRPCVRETVHAGVRHRIYPLLEAADFDAVYVRGDAMWTKAAWSVNGTSGWKLLRGTSALAAGCVKLALDQVGTAYDQPKPGAVVTAEERGEDEPPAPVDPATPGAIRTPTVDALVAAIKEVAAFNPAVTFATNTAVNGTVSFAAGIAFAEGGSKTLEIHGPMTFDAQGRSRFFTVPNGLTLKLYDITFVNGKVEGEDESGAGGAILVLDGGTLYASNCTFRANAATYGGAVAQLGDTSSTTFIDCTFDGNAAADPEYGNAIYHEGTSGLVLEGTSIDAADIMDWPDVVLTTPVIASIDVGDGTAGRQVAVLPRDPQPNVYYGLAWTADPAAGFSAETVAEWVRSDGHGVLPKPLTAPATGDRCFYRIFVRGEKP